MVPWHGICLLLLGFGAAPVVLADETVPPVFKEKAGALPTLRGSASADVAKPAAAALPAHGEVQSLAEGSEDDSKEGDDSKNDGSLPKWIAPYLIAIIVYGVLYAIVKIYFSSDSAEYAKAHQAMCCWRDIYLGRACLIYDILFCPIVMPLHAIRIYLGNFCCVYGTRCYWLSCGGCSHYYQDADFPPEAKSIGNVQGDAARKGGGSTDAEVRWVRAMDLHRKDITDKAPHPKLHDTDMKLFRKKILPRDILQGALGDCWLLAAMAAAADRPGILESLFVTDEINPAGKYTVVLYHPQKKEWVRITVDDYVPCKRATAAYSGSKDGIARDKNGHCQTLYATPKGTEVWTLILEKAFAKMCGSFASLDGGTTEWAMSCMTGKDAWAYWKMEPGKWQRYNLVINDNPKNIRDVGWKDTDYWYDSDAIFKRLRYYSRNGAMIACSGPDDEGAKLGLVKGHAFSVLEVHAVKKSIVSEDFFRMVKIRNPWGHMDATGAGEWKGTWSDFDHQSWDTYPHVRKLLGVKDTRDVAEEDDGVFWMQWEDFVKHWNTISIVDVDMNILTLVPPIHDESNWYGPMKVCAAGCLEYWAPPWCYGLRRLYIGEHSAKARELEDEDVGKTCGIDASGCYCRCWEQNPVHLKS